MVKIHLVFVGKQKESWVSEGIGHYKKLLRGLVDLEVKVIGAEKVTKSSNPLSILEKEKDKITKNLKDKTFLIILDTKGKQLSSEELAGVFKDRINQGQSDFTLVVGSSLGLSEDIKRRGSLRLSLSRMTFPHELTWVILLEQVYRVFSIIKGTKYHK